MTGTTTGAAIAYCGSPPSPADLMGAWNLDPVLIAALLIYVPVALRYSANRNAAFGAWALAWLFFVSPLCALTSALFSARVLHHVVLIAAIAPLLAVAFPNVLRRGLPAGAVFLAHLVALWVWHAPGPYAWALSTVWGYWFMQATLLLTAWALWHEVLRPQAAAMPLALLLGTVGHMGLLGALLVFTPTPLYVAHFATTEAWGLQPLVDQQLAGLMMWVPAMLPYLAVGTLIALRHFPSEAEEPGMPSEEFRQ
ncbi:cytochrome c oxidase assembly protein [Halodurantibacterium flavum]|uniref:Cytochrome c oxidase assembly protein n=1 Tax=Halodurantibacterium flavum TaxID=1382802 RepID=A0ABW4S3B1_9RHOB